MIGGATIDGKDGAPGLDVSGKGKMSVVVPVTVEAVDEAELPMNIIYRKVLILALTKNKYFLIIIVYFRKYESIHASSCHRQQGSLKT